MYVHSKHKNRNVFGKKIKANINYNWEKETKKYDVLKKAVKNNI